MLATVAIVYAVTLTVPAVAVVIGIFRKAR
jgi:hypothetical protein